MFRLGARAYYTLSSLVRESDGPQEVVRLPQVWMKTLISLVRGFCSGAQVAKGQAAPAQAGQEGGGQGRGRKGGGGRGEKKGGGEEEKYEKAGRKKEDF